jgi:sigma-B regulation protein RsbU (phosphoserine phosphatase)
MHDALERIRNVERGAYKPLQDLGVEYVIPLMANELLEAWFLIADFADTDDESANDVIFIETVGNILSMSLSNIQLFEEKLAAERIQREIELAGDIQNQSLPKNFDLHPRLDIHAHSVPHSSVAGDFYNLIQLSEHEIIVFMADAAGKGIAAALLITNIQANLNALLRTGASYAQIIGQLHSVIGRLTHHEQFVTLFLGKINMARNEIEYINAGHNPPALLHEGEVSRLNDGCIPLGIMEVRDFKVGQSAFVPGDTLFLYTDGLVEQTDPSGVMFGEEGVDELVAANANSNANRLINSALRSVAKHANGVDYHDDISLMAITYKT